MTAPKVLIVNDHAPSLLVLKTVLASAPENNDYEIISASSGEDALRQVLRHEFAVILLDVNMPGMDGFETAEAIRSSKRGASIPIIFMTAYHPDDLSKLKGYRKGAVDYLFTPVIPEILQMKVSVFVELTRKNLLLQQKTAELAELNEDLRVQRVHDLQRINAALKMEVIERRQAEMQAHEMATRDALTGLLNRRSLLERLDNAVTRAERRQEPLAVMFLDVDKFKSVNDTYGHQVGDDVLRQVAERINTSVRRSDMVARFGGDEFVVLLEGISTYVDAGELAEKILLANAGHCVSGAHRIPIALSVGVAIFPRDGTSAQQLMECADLAMYQAKEGGGAKICEGGRVQFFHERFTLTHPLKVSVAQGNGRAGDAEVSRTPELPASSQPTGRSRLH